MSVKIKVSYNTENELARVLGLLSPVLKTCKVAKEKKGPYKRAYIVAEPRENRGKTKNEL